VELLTPLEAVALLAAFAIWWWVGPEDDTEPTSPAAEPTVVDTPPPPKPEPPRPEVPIMAASRATFGPDTQGTLIADGAGAELAVGTLRLEAGDDETRWRLDLPAARVSFHAGPATRGYVIVSPARRDVAGDRLVVPVTIHLFAGELTPADGDETRTVSAPVSIRRTYVVGDATGPREEVAVEWGREGPGTELSRDRYVLRIRFDGDSSPERYRFLSYPRLPAGPRLALADLLDQAKRLRTFPALDAPVLDGLRDDGLLDSAVSLVATHRPDAAPEFRIHGAEGAVLARGDEAGLLDRIPEALRPRAERLVRFHRVPRPARPERAVEVRSIPLDEKRLAELVGAPVRLPPSLRGKFVKLAYPVEMTPEELLLMLAKKMKLRLGIGPDGYQLTLR